MEKKIYDSRGKLVGCETKKEINYTVLSLKAMTKLEDVYDIKISLSNAVSITKKYIKKNKMMYDDEIVELEDKIIKEVREKIDNGEIQKI